MSNKTVLFKGNRLRITADHQARQWLVEIRDRNRNLWRVKERVHHKNSLISSLAFWTTEKDVGEYPDLDSWPVRFGQSQQNGRAAR